MNENIIRNLSLELCFKRKDVLTSVIAKKEEEEEESMQIGICIQLVL